jgi:sirohydrochlorin cobaltochelatase
MDAVVLFSHGSVLTGAGEALERHAERIRRRAVAPIVEHAYLNYTEPDLPTTVARCVAAGAGRIVVTPYFLAAGKFVTADVPAAVAAAAERFPAIRFIVAEAIGYDPALADAILESALNPGWEQDRAAGAAGREALVVVAHGSPRAEANDDLVRVVGDVDLRRMYGIVRAGFLECNAPSIPEAIDLCVAGGARAVIVAPYFLHTGAHVAEDIPAILRAASERHPGVRLLQSPYLGLSEAITEILIARTISALNGA